MLSHTNTRTYSTTHTITRKRTHALTYILTHTETRRTHVPHMDIEPSKRSVALKKLRLEQVELSRAQKPSTQFFYCIIHVTTDRPVRIYVDIVV